MRERKAWEKGILSGPAEGPYGTDPGCRRLEAVPEDDSLPTGLPSLLRPQGLSSLSISFPPLAPLSSSPLESHPLYSAT